MLYHYKAKIDNVVDGDTVDFEYIDLGFDILLKGKRARLLGVDTYELKSKILMEKELAQQGKEYMINRVLNKEVILRSREYEITDSFGRLLVDIYVENVLVNDELVHLGLAEIYNK